MPTALFYDGARGARLSEAAPGEGLALTALFSAVSRGTERLVWAGRVPVSEHVRMRGPFQEGDFPGPVKYGYAMVARTEDGVPGFVLHPHQDRFQVPASAFRPLPEGCAPEAAVLTPNLETALNAVWDAGIGPGDHVTVVGAGVVGCLVGWLAGRMPGTRVTLVDVLEARARVAGALGCRFALPDAAPVDQDAVFHCSATADGLATALRAAGDEATVTELSWYGAGEVPAALGGAFHSRRLTLRSSQVARLPVSRRPRWTPARRLGVALSLVSDPALAVLVDSEGSFADLPSDLPRIFGSPTLAHRVCYG